MYNYLFLTEFSFFTGPVAQLDLPQLHFPPFDIQQAFLSATPEVSSKLFRL